MTWFTTAHPLDQANVDKRMKFLEGLCIKDKLNLTEREVARLATLLCDLAARGIDFESEAVLLQIAKASARVREQTRVVLGLPKRN